MYQHLYQITIHVNILLTAVADVSKGQTDMPYQGEHQTLTEQSMRQHICPDETISAINVLMSRGRGNCGISDNVRIYTTYYLIFIIYYYILLFIIY